MFFVLGANGVQNSFFFCFPDNEEAEFSHSIARDRQKAGEQVFRESYDVYIFITKDALARNIFFSIAEKVAIITTATWERYFSPPSIFHFLLHSILCASTYSLSDFTVSSHREFTSGCQFEYTRVKSHDRIDIALGYICDEHRHLVERTLGKSALADLLLLFSFSWLGKEEDNDSLVRKMKRYFRYDINRESGYIKNFLERAQTQIDSLWLEFFKEIFKGVILIVTAFLLLKFGLTSVK